MPDDPGLEAPPDIRLRIDQTVDLASDDRPVHVSPLEQAYLLLLQQAGPRGIGREEVFGLLWTMGDSGPARHRLRQLNYNLKRKGGGPVVETRGSVVRLAEGVAVEWGPDPAWDSFPTPTPAFEDRIEGMKGARARAAAREVVHELETARLTDAPERVLRFLGRGHTSPTAWRDALWALLRTGRIREAEFELRRAYGDRVPAEGLSLGRRLASHASKLLNTAATGGELSIPLIGRSAEAQRLNMLLAQETPSILLTGVHGAGRSRLLGHAVATLLTGGEDVVALSARGGDNQIERPFGGLTQLLSEQTLPQAHDELGQPDHEVLSRALPVHFESRGPHHLAQIGGPGSYLRVARAVEALFQQAFGSAEVVLCVDDLHAIDRSTLEVIAFLLRDQAVRLLASWCTEGPGTSTELLLRVQNLRAELVPLSDLDIESAARFARAVDGDISDDQAIEIARVAGGRPGRIVDLIRALGGGGLPQMSHGPSLDGLLRARVREMGAAEQEVLIFLAVHRGRLSVEALARLLGTGTLEAAGYARALEESGLVRIDPDETAVVPGLMRDFITRELPSSVREKTHLRIADALEESESDDYASIGHHRLAAGRPTEAAAWFQKAAANAKGQTAYAEAISLIERSIAAADDYDPDLGGDLGRLYFGMGDFQNSIHSYQRARAAYGRSTSAAELHLRLGQLEVELEQGKNRQQLFSDVKAVQDIARRLNDLPLVASAIDLHLKIADYAHDPAEVDAAREQLLEEVRSQPFHPSLGIVAARLCYLGDPPAALALSRRAYLTSRGDLHLRQRALSRLLMCLAHQSRFHGHRARILIEEANRLANGTGDLNTRFGLWANRVVWLMDRGRWDDAEQVIERSMRFVVGQDSVERQTITVNRCVLAVRRGDIATAAKWIEAARRWRPSPRESLNALHDACALIVAVKNGSLEVAAKLYSTLDRIDLTFPFSSDLSLVPIALSTFLKATGHREKATHLLNAAVRQMAFQSDAALARLRIAAK